MRYHIESMSKMGKNRNSNCRDSSGVRRNQQGMAAILITMITMIVITLIVLGFATISRREQSNTLGQQLSTQAFYAAESAVNDARDVINTAVKSGQAVPAKTSCNTNTDGGGYSPNYPVPVAGQSGVVLDGSHNVSYTCLLVNPSPTSLVKDGLGADSWVVPVNSSSPYDTIQLQWTPDPASPSGTPSTDCPSSTDQFSPASGAGAWTCKYAVLRVDLVPTTGALTSAGLASNQLTGFFEPQGSVGGSTNLPYDAAHKGKANVVAASCNIGSYGTCTATITGLSGTNYTLRLISLYGTSDVTVTPESSGSPVPTTGEVVVDATGDADGVLRRIQVRLPTSDYNGIIPDDAIQSNSAICKRFYVTPSYYANAGDVINPQTSTSDPNYNPMCDNNLPSSGSP